MCRRMHNIHFVYKYRVPDVHFVYKYGLLNAAFKLKLHKRTTSINRARLSARSSPPARGISQASPVRDVIVQTRRPIRAAGPSEKGAR